MTFEKKLKALRLQNELTQSEIAEKLKVSQSYYSAIESGRKAASKKIFRQLLEMFSLPKDYFLIDNDSKGDSLKNEGDKILPIYGQNIQSSILDEIIKTGLHNISFYCIDLIYRSHYIKDPNVKLAVPVKEVRKVEEWITEVKQELTERQMSDDEKIELIRVLVETTNNLLGRIWDLTQFAGVS